MKVLNEYPGRHHYWEEYEKTELHCPLCGDRSVWSETGPGDFYVGADFLCTSCSAVWTMQGPEKTKEINVMGKLAQLRQGKTFEPTTRKER